MNATGKPRSTACAVELLLVATVGAGSERGSFGRGVLPPCARRRARQQGARSLELRAAVSLSRLWQADGRDDEARELLAPIYEWFTEGLDTSRPARGGRAPLTELSLPP